MRAPAPVTERWRVLVPFDHREAIEVSVAAKIANRTPETVRRWCDQFGVGRKVGGLYLVSRPALAMFLDGDDDALGLYLAGDRTSPLVRHYFTRVGLPGLHL